MPYPATPPTHLNRQDAALKTIIAANVLNRDSRDQRTEFTAIPTTDAGIIRLIRDLHYW